MWVDLNGNAFLNEEYTLDKSPGGTCCLQVTKVSEGYIVHLDTFSYFGEKYEWTKSAYPGFNTLEEKCYGKVLAFSLEEYEDIQRDPNKLREQINKCILNEDYEQAQYFQNILDQL